MGVPRTKPATYQDLLAVPEHLVAEIVDGELYASPALAPTHAHSTTNLLGELVGTPGWIILFRPELHLAAQVLVPDIAGWRRERMPVIPDVPFLELAPDWICEVVSPSTAALDRAKKMPHYQRVRVRHIWLVDPTPKTLEIFRSDGEGWRLLATHAGEVKVRAEPFDAIELDLSVLWAR
jgi:Uma2 family endonuclease